VDSPGGRWTYGLSEPLQRGGAQSLHRGADGQGAFAGGASKLVAWETSKEMGR